MHACFFVISFQSFWGLDANWSSTPPPNIEVYFKMEIS